MVWVWEDKGKDQLVVSLNKDLFYYERLTRPGAYTGALLFVLLY